MSRATAPRGRRHVVAGWQPPFRSYVMAILLALACLAPASPATTDDTDVDLADEDTQTADKTLDHYAEHSAEYSLYNTLLGSNRYQKHVRPVRKHRQPIKVKVGMCVMMIEEIIERDQIMTMAACIKMRWNDDFLVWKPSDYDNLTWLAISSTNIWLPDIAIINSPEPYELTRKETNVDVDFRGEVGFFPSGRLATRCNLLITFFPFDWQHCEVRLESWIYPTQYLEIELYPDAMVDLKEYYTNHQWAVAGYRVLPEVADYDGKNFSSITFTYILRRKSEYYFMYFIFPQLLLSLLQTLSHTLPVEHPGRMAMLTSLFIGTSVTQAGIAVHIPKSSDSMSLLQIYMTIMSINLVFALIVTFVMMYAVLRYPNEEPSFIAMMIAFFSIVWPSDIVKKRKHHHNPAPAYHHKRSNMGMTCHISSPFVKDSVKLKPKSSLKSRDTIRSWRESSPGEDDRGRAHRAKRKSTKKYGAAETMLVADKDMTSFRKIMQQQTPSPGTLSGAFAARRLTKVSDPSDDDEDFSPRSVRTTRAKIPNGHVPESAFKSPYARQKSSIDSSSDLMGIDFSPMNPNIDMPWDAEEGARSRSMVRKRSSYRGEAASMDETRELKRRWLLYCVALDKTIMYANMVWNIAVPLVLFAVVPVLSPHPFLVSKNDQ